MERTDPQAEIDRLLHELKAGVSQNLSPVVDSLRHQIVRLSTGINVREEWQDEPAIDLKWKGYGLTGSERRLLGFLMKAGPAGLSKERLMALQYANESDDWPGLKVLDVRICYIRAKFEHYEAPWHIETVHGEGWILHEGAGQPRLGRTGFHVWSTPNRHPGRHSRAAPPSPPSIETPRPAK